MQTLREFISDNNRWVAIFGKPEITFPLTQADVTDILRTLDSNLSPENLHCDGEISHSQAMQKYRFYKAVAQELKQYCAKHNLTYTELMEL
jgi:hypothetical protein